MLNYSQPDFYHFSEDSTTLSEVVAATLDESFTSRESFKGLDLCCGCGVVGIEFLLRKKIELDFTFCDIQSDFAPHLWKNFDFLTEKQRAKVSSVYSSFVQLQGSGKYDLIVSNPPYFDPAHGRLGENMAKQMCRFFINESMESYLVSIKRLLKKKGVCYFLMRDNMKIELLLLSNKYHFQLDEHSLLSGATIYLVKRL